MITIESFGRTQVADGNGTQIDILVDEFLGMKDVRCPFLLVDGVLETYMEGYEATAEEALSALLLDAFNDDIEVLPFLDEGAKEGFKKIAAMEKSRAKWQCDKKGLVATALLPKDSPKTLARREMKEKAKGYIRAKEERLAAEFVDTLPTATRTQPRNLNPEKPEPSLGLAIQFVP